MQIVRGLRGMLSSEPLPPGHRAPVAAVAAAALATAGDVGLRTRACNALWPALRVLGRVPMLRDVGTELSRVVYHEVFLSLQVRAERRRRLGGGGGGRGGWQRGFVFVARCLFGLRVLCTAAPFLL